MRASLQVQHQKNEEIVGLLRRVLTELRDVLAGQTSPMVLGVLAHLVSARRKVNSCGQVLGQTVDHNPDQLSADELHQMAWPVIEQQPREARRRD